ncbi:hypothetical protein NMG60_11005177 [Bertholletia excelsa]
MGSSSYAYIFPEAPLTSLKNGKPIPFVHLVPEIRKFLLPLRLVASLKIRANRRKKQGGEQGYCKMVKPRSRRSRSTLPDLYPKFFKVFLPDSSSKQLKIPLAFVKHFNGILNLKSTLSGPGNKAWSVDLENVAGEFFFKKGWEEFVEYNCLEFGDFLIFKYLDNSRFIVEIYGVNGCEKENPRIEMNPVKRCDNKNMSCCDDKQRNDDCVLLEENQRWKPGKYEELVSKEISAKRLAQQSSVSTVCEGARRKDRIFKPARKNPCFQVVMRSAYVSHGTLNIPFNFVKAYGKIGKQRATLCQSNKSWPVNLNTYEPGYCKLSKGWHTFVEANTLKKGDTCIFELVNKNDLKFNVSIIRHQN